MLAVNARAAREQHPRSPKSIEKIAGTVQVDFAICICIAAARASTVDNRFERSCPRANLSLIRYIDLANRIRLNR
jgi:hypothetical protein